MRYLIIGPKMTNDPQTHGGTPVLVEQLLKFCNKNSIDYKFINTSFFGEGRGGINFIYTLITFLIKLPKSDIVIVNVSRNGAYYFSPIALFFTKLFKKRFVFRRFGGNCLELYSKAKGIKKRLIEYVFKNSDIMFFEPKFIVEYFKKQRDNVYSLPNAREESPYKRDLNKPYSKSFIFLGEVRRGKGIQEILEAFNRLDSSYQVTLYGSLKYGDYTKEYLESFKNVKYGGLLNHSEIYKKLSESDVLLLPSYKEGYPGVIIEAFAVGIAMIVSSIDSIKEMVNDSVAKLVEPKDIDDLKKEVEFFNQENYIEYAKASREKFKEYETNSLHKKMIEICQKDLK